MKYASLILLTLIILVCGCTSPKVTSSDLDENNDINEEKKILDNNAETEIDSEMADFSSLYKEGYLSDHKVSYEWETIQGADGEAESGTYSTYRKGIDKYRFDYSQKLGETRAYLVGKDISSCSLDEDKWQCMKYTQESNLFFPPFTMPSADEMDTWVMYYTFVDSGTETIAGEKTNCYSISHPESGKSKFCLTDEGIVLFSERIDPNGIRTTLTATTFSRSVPDSDFDLPAEPIDMNKLIDSMEESLGKESGDPCSFCNDLPEELRADCLEGC
jgi:hypothetical protein